MSELGWYRPTKAVSIEEQFREVRQVTELGWYRPTKAVSSEVQVREG